MAYQGDQPKSKNTKKQKATVDACMKDVRAALDSSAVSRVNFTEDIKFSVGGRGQWLAADIAELEAQKRPAMSFNNIHPMINLLCGLEEESRQDYRYFPVGSEDEFMGRISTLAVKSMLTRCGGLHEEGRGFRLGTTCGQSALKVFHDYQYTDDLIEGDIKVICLETNTHYYDPRARHYTKIDARYQGDLFWMSAEEIEDNWPGHHARMTSLKDWLPYEPMYTGVPDHMQRELWDRKQDMIRVVCHYYRVPTTVTLLINRAAPPDQAVERMKNEKEAEAKIQRIYDEAGAAAAAPFQMITTTTANVVMNRATGDMMPVLDANQGQQVIDGIKADAGRAAASTYEVLTRDTTSIRVAHLTGWELLNDVPFEDFDSWRFPYALFTCFQDSDSLDDIKGWVRDLKDPQREVNWHHSTMVDTLNRAPKGQTWLHQAEQPNLEKLKKELSRPGFVGTYTTTTPTYLPPGTFSPADLALVEFGLDQFNRIGIPAEMMGLSTQKTISGRAKQASQAGSMTALGATFSNWKRTKEYLGLLYLKAIQQHYSAEKLDRVIGTEGRMREVLGITVGMPPAQMYEAFKRLPDIDFDVAIGFQDLSPSGRQALFTQMMQMAAIGIPVPPELMLETSEVPYKEEIKAALAKQGMQAPNPAMLQAVGASQGQGPNAGINTSQ